MCAPTANFDEFVKIMVDVDIFAENRNSFPWWLQRNFALAHGRKSPSSGSAMSACRWPWRWRAGAPVIGFDISQRGSRNCARATTAPARSRRRTAEARSPDRRSGRALAEADFSSSRCRPRSMAIAVPIWRRCWRASQTVGRGCKRATSWSTNSTVYPGATGEDCVPVLAKARG